MRILTGADREYYENLIRMNAQAVTRMALYEELIRDLREDVNRERERANRAVDAQLAVRGFPTVTPPTSIPDFPDVLEEDPEAVAKVEARMQQGDATVFAERF
jgi:hypothetical protein